MLSTSPGTVIVGAGHAGFTAAVALRDAGYEYPITLVHGESGLPYHRPALTKGYLLNKVSRERIAFRPAEFYARRGIALRLGHVEGLDRSARTVLLDGNEVVDFEHLVLATGAQPRRLTVHGHDLGNIAYVRSVADADALGSKLREARRLVVIGGGFLGLELAAVAREMGAQVTVIEAAPRLLPKAVSACTASFLETAHQTWGSSVRTGASVRALHGNSTGCVSQVELADGETIETDLVVVGVGATPNTAVAESAGLAVGDGVLVDAYLRTSDPRVHAIGDCARFTSLDGATTRRVESVQNATDQGRTVALALGGQPNPYLAPPWFWSDQHDIKLQIAGDLTGHDQTRVGGRPAAGTFSTYCFRAGKLIAVESINSPSDHVAGRKVLQRRDFNLDPQLIGPGFALAEHLKKR